MTKSVLLFDLKAAQRRRIAKSGIPLDQFSGRTWRAIARDDAAARETIQRAQVAARGPVRFLVMDEGAFAAGWGVATDDAAFGGPFWSAS